MGNLYMLDRRLGRIGIAIAARDDAATAVLIQDGVTLDCGRLHSAGRRIYALRRDAEQRGLLDRLPPYIVPIDYGTLVDLIVAQKVITFL